MIDIKKGNSKTLTLCLYMYYVPWYGDMSMCQHMANKWSSTLKAVKGIIVSSRYHCNMTLKDKYPNFEVGLKCIIMVF